MDVPARHVPSLRDELRLHARYIRDTLVPILSRQPKLTQSDHVLLGSILKKLDHTNITLDLLRYSRMEKALMVIAAAGPDTWTMELVLQAEQLMRKWENELGPLKDLRADLYGPGGRLDGVRKITDGKRGGLYDRDDELKSAWSVTVSDPLRSYGSGSLGFEVGDWWIKPAAAYRDGIIDKTSHAITADNNAAYAIVLNESREVKLQPNGTFTYHAAMDDPGALKLMKTMTTNTGKIVRILRSWKLRSVLAPKAGLRYDGLYRIESFGIRLLPSNVWHKTFTLSRVPNQPPISVALAYPKSDQLDDWRDYQRLKNLDRGEDFDTLREIMREPTVDFNDESNSEDKERHDSGYFSRRSSKLSSRMSSTPGDGLDGEGNMISTAASRITSFRDSMLENVDEVDFIFAAESISSSPESEPHAMHPGEPSSSFLDGTDEVQDSAASDTNSCHTNRTSRTEIRRSISRTSNSTSHRVSANEDRWTSQWGIWRTSGLNLDGIEEGEFVDWASSRHGGYDNEDEAIPPDETVYTDRHVHQRVKRTPVDSIDRGEDAARLRRFSSMAE